MRGTANFLRFSVAKRDRIRLEFALGGEEAVMVLAAIAVAVLLVLVALFCAGLYLSYRRSRAISTAEWVKLMRENDLQFDRAARARAAKSRRSKVR
jgi:hypothetical protein